MTTESNAEELRKAGFGNGEKSLDSLGFSREDRGQRYPQRNPQDADALGDPLTIREVARLIGCSPWTVRQRYLPEGLPHMRSGRLGKLIFYRAQVVRWILQRQQKGGR